MPTFIAPPWCSGWSLGLARETLRELADKLRDRLQSGILCIGGRQNDKATLLIAVTILTSSSADDLRAVGINRDTDAMVERLAVLAKDQGLEY